MGAECGRARWVPECGAGRSRLLASEVAWAELNSVVKSDGGGGERGLGRACSYRVCETTMDNGHVLSAAPPAATQRAGCEV